MCGVGLSMVGRLALNAALLIASVAASAQAPAPDRAVGTRFRDCPKCPEMVVIPAGTFAMGTSASTAVREPDEGPQVAIRIPRALAVGRFEVTFAEWDACAAAGGCRHIPGDRGWGRGTRPVIHVDWSDAQNYLRWLNQRVLGAGYRLLTEAEWEYAARAGTTAPYVWGDAIGQGNANCGNCGSKWDYRQTAPVGSFAANGFGLHDMQGNVWEWVEDCYRDNLIGQPVDGAAYVTPPCTLRVLRGGGWKDPPFTLRAAFRGRQIFNARPSDIGFRVARALGG